MKIAIVEARFYDDIADAMARDAIDVLKKSGADYERIAVPGTFEIPAAISMLDETEEYDGFVALGCVIRGETTHYDYVCGESARGLQDLAVQNLVAIGYGIITAENRDQAWARVDGTKEHKGKDAANAVLRMVELRKKIPA